ncbi:L-dopachrome tautomerase yellow-f-like isoform X3 [Anticarsia gemmatalis]|uniref:L-dopachrome tautomerase yellow-f-like isoform X3 n=1 Tax=Anticarsia gemmatalis TaxID=129554 RepID=UPI003F75F41A
MIVYTKDTRQAYTVDGIFFKEDELEQKDYFFTQDNNVPIGFDVFRDRMFITVPRRRFGIPSTLNFISNTTEYSPLLKPYPDVASVNQFVSVYRPKVDECGRLWMVDTGLLEVPQNRKQIKQPEIIIFDLKTDTEILRYQLKPTDLSNGTTSGLTSITVDVTLPNCDDAYAYINDLAAEGLIVFSLKERDSWRFSHSTFGYDEGATNFTIGANSGEYGRDDSFLITFRDGLFSVALTSPDARGIRTVIYHPFIATQEFAITNDVLKNKHGDIDNNFRLLGVKGPYSQSGSHAYHPATRTVLFANTARDGILCWHIDKTLTPANTALIAQDHEKLLYISDLKIVGEYVWVLVNQIPRFIQWIANLSDTRPTYYVFWGKISDLVADTVCDQYLRTTKKRT